MRPIGVNMSVGTKYSVDELAKAMVKAGFTYAFTNGESDIAGDATLALKKHGAKMLTLHAPFYRNDKTDTTVNNMWDPLGSEKADEMYARLDDSLIKCAKYEVPYMICHLSSGIPPCINDNGIYRFKKLYEHSLELGVTICFENQRIVSNLALALEQFDKSAFCWDTGHEIVFAGGKEYMPVFGNRIQQVHLQDNRGIPENDVHLIPGDGGGVDFDKVGKYLAKYKFNSALMLEVKWLQNPEYADLSPDEFYTRCAKGARMVEACIEKYEKQ